MDSHFHSTTIVNSAPVKEKPTIEVKTTRKWSVEIAASAVNYAIRIEPVEVAETEIGHLSQELGDGPTKRFVDSIQLIDPEEGGSPAFILSWDAFEMLYLQAKKERQFALAQSALDQHGK